MYPLSFIILQTKYYETQLKISILDVVKTNLQNLQLFAYMFLSNKHEHINVYESSLANILNKSLHRAMQK
jgi:hypothetical protein